MMTAKAMLVTPAMIMMGSMILMASERRLIIARLMLTWINWTVIKMGLEMLVKTT